jgi:hypothetical protein
MSQHEHLAFAPPADPGFGRALLLALLVHFLLLLVRIYLPGIIHIMPY